MTEATTQKALAIAEINPIVTELAAFEGTIDSIDVTDEETQADVGDLVKLLQSRRAKIDQKRKDLVKPLNGVVKEINALFKVPIERIDAVVQTAKKKMSRFAEAKLAIEREKKRQEEEAARKEREESEALAKRLAAKAGDTGQEVAETLMEQAEEKVEKVTKKRAKVAVNRGKASSVVTTTSWEVAVVDKEALIKAVAAGDMSSDLLEPNMAALKKLSVDTKMEREVHGVRFWEKIGTMVR